MSFLNICGKISICPECEKTVQVEYNKGGAHLTQIGDLRIEQQIELCKEKGLSNDNPNIEEYYQYDILICSDCYNSLINKNTHNLSVKSIKALRDLKQRSL